MFVAVIAHNQWSSRRGLKSFCKSHELAHIISPITHLTARPSKNQVVRYEIAVLPGRTKFTIESRHKAFLTLATWKQPSLPHYRQYLQGSAVGWGGPEHKGPRLRARLIFAKKEMVLHERLSLELDLGLWKLVVIASVSIPPVSDGYLLIGRFLNALWCDWQRVRMLFSWSGTEKSLALVHSRPSLATDLDGLAPVHAKAECTDQ